MMVYPYVIFGQTLQERLKAPISLKQFTRNRFLASGVFSLFVDWKSVLSKKTYGFRCEFETPSKKDSKAQSWKYEITIEGDLTEGDYFVVDLNDFLKTSKKLTSKKN
jgi:hypothetical protein